jgi:hypothetical protein
MPPELRLQVHDAVRRRLQDLDPIPPDDVTRKLMHAEIDRFVASFRREQELKKILLDCRDGVLPYAARGSWGELSQWQIRAVKVAAAAIGQLRNDAAIEEIRAVAIHAVRQLTAEFEHQRLCEEIASQAWLCLRGGTGEERQQSQQLVAQALKQLPVGSTRKQMEAARDAALAPIRDAAAQRQAQEQVEQRRKQDHANRQAVASRVSWQLPWGFPTEQRQPAHAAVCKALAELPEGTPQRELEQARDRALQPFLTAHERQKRRTQLIEDGLRGIYSYLQKLERDWDFEGKTARTLETEIREPIRKQLEKELAGDESAEQVEKLVQRLVREEVGIERRKVYVHKAG